MKMSSEDDILVELKKNQIIELKETYRPIEEACYVYTLLDVAERWYGTAGITVTSPGDAWKEDGSVIVFIDLESTAIFPYSLDKTYRKIREGLLKTTKIGRKSFYFLNIMESYKDIILDVVKLMKRKVEKPYDNFFYTMSIEKAKSLEIQVPAETYMKELDERHVYQMNRVWPHRFENSEKALKSWLARNVGYGLFLKETDELVSWVMQGFLGHINLLQTEIEYMGRGYGKVLLLTMAKHLAESGHVPAATVLMKNTASNSLFRKQGFDCKANCCFLLISEYTE